VGGTKTNTLTFEQIEAMGTYFVTPAFGFTLQYLRRFRLSFLHARTAPGQEARVVLDFLNEVMQSELELTQISLRDHLLHAMEGNSVAMLRPTSCIPFDIDYSADIDFSGRDALGFGEDVRKVKVAHLVFDGLFGVHRILEKGIDIRTKVLAGRPRKRTIKEWERSATCASKNKERATIPNRTGGWQFVCDGHSGEVLVGYEHINNECNNDKHIAIQGAMSMYDIKPRGLVHDDNCTFEKWVSKRSTELRDKYKTVIDYVIDHFHKKNHKCEKKAWTPAQKRRLNQVNTSCFEQFNAFLRRYNFFLNSLRPSSHRFWVSELAKYFNKNKGKIRAGPVRRKNVGARMSKRPAGTTRKQCVKKK
jgi:hypothetical protein